MDDAPQAFDDANSVTEDAPDPIIGNVITDVNAGGEVDHVGADGAKVSAIISDNVTGNTAAEVAGDLVIEGEYGTLTINPDGSYTYELDNTNPAVNALKTGDTLTENFTYTLTDADLDADDAKLVITINGRTDGNPTIVPEDKNGADPSDLLTAGQVTVYESGLTTDGPSGQSKTAAGEITVEALDGLISVSVAGQTFDIDALASLNTTNVTIDTEYGILTLNGFTPMLVDGIIVGGELTYSYELTKPFNNTEPGEEGDKNGLDTLDLKVVDAGNAESTGSLIINIIDDEPSIGTPEDNIVHESGLLGGTEAGVADTTVTGDLQVRVGADSDAGGGLTANVRFDGVQTALEGLGLSSDYDASNDPIPVNYIVSPDGYTLTAYKGSDPTDKVFTVTITDPNSNAAGYEFTLHQPLNHGTAESLDLPFGFSVIDGDNDPDNSSFTITVTDDAPGDNYVLNIVEDSLSTTPENTFNTSADANSTNTVISVTGGIELVVIDDGEGGKTYSYPDMHTGPQDFYGSVTVNADGSITYVPDSNYSNPSSEDTFTYTTINGDDISVVPVVVHVKPVADAPDLEDNKVLETPEDTSISLALKVPLVTDNTQTEGATSTDYPERLGEITVSFSPTSGTDYGSGTDAFNDFTSGIKLLNGANELTPDADGKFHFVIIEGVNDGWHITPGLPTAETGNGVYYITEAQYQALTVLPPVDRHENFEVVVSVDSYEVDVGGEPLPGIDPANSTQTITVDVHAVTDDVGLKVKEGDAQADVTVVISNADKTADITFNEDTSFNLTNILAPDTFKDTDGSETRYLGLKGLPDGTIVNVAGVDYVIGQASTPTVNFGGSVGEIPTITIVGTETGLPNITITPPKDFSGDLTGVKVVLGAKDSDSDSPAANPEAVMDEVTINLHVKPVAGDVAITGTAGLEDTAIMFLENIKVTDDSTAAGTLGEVITEVSFTLPTGWTPDAGAGTWSNNGQTWTMAPSTTSTDKWTGAWDGNKYTITFTDDTLTKSEREDILKEFTVTPPAHSSKDISLEVKVTSVDHSVISGGSSSDPASKTGTLTVVVKPVAERVETDTDQDGSDDLKMGSDHVYQTSGEEDQWFALGDETSASFKLSTGWSNEDGKWIKTGGNWVENTDDGRSEDTFALLTPFKTEGNSAMEGAATDGMLKGSVFTYSDGTTTFTIPFTGEPVKIPMQYLDSVQFRGPKDWAGVVKIKVEAHTIDHGEDPTDTPVTATSGESWLTNLIIDPRADQFTFKVDSPIKTLEDTPVKLNIIPTTSAKNETFDITISGIPKGATIRYWDNGTEKTFTADTDNSSLSITNFDKTKQPELTPPKDSNELINLTVKAESVDTLTYINDAGQTVVVEHKGTTKTTKVYGNGADQDPTSTTTETVGSDTSHELPIEVEVQGVPDTPNGTIVNGNEYLEDGGTDQEAATGLEVALKDLVTSMESGETGVDGAGPDGSETITLRISDLPEGFTLIGAGPQLGAGSGAERVWVISKADLDNVQIVVPEHYSGTVKFTVQPVVTESDNPSEVFFDKQNVSFKVNPVPEASLSVESNLLEDIIGQLSLTAVGADTDEYISEVRISANEVANKGLTLHAADGTQLTPEGGYYTFTYNGSNDQKAPDVYVKGPANHSGDIKLNIEYTVTDPVVDATIAPATKDGTVEHTLSFAPVTDKIDLSLGSIDGGTTNDGVTTQVDPGNIKVKLNIEQKADPNADSSVNDGKDIDGSEQLTHILITGVPAGVSVLGAVETATGQWLMTVAGEEWNGNAVLEHELEFVVSGYAAPFTDKTITITTYSKDTGATAYEKDSVEWKLTYTRDGIEEGNDLPDVSLDALDNLVEQEDAPFSLGAVVQGEIDAATAGTGDYNVTLTIRTKEGDNTTFDGMTATQVVENGETITLWTKTEKVNTGESGQAKLEQMLAEIKVNSPQDANSNNLTDGKLSLDINLSVHADGISRDDSAKPEVVITPVTDDITIGVSTNIEGEGTDVALNIMLPTNTVDGDLGAAAGWTIVDGKVYIHVADDGTGLKGQLTDAGGTALDVYTGTAPDGAPLGGKLYAVDVDNVAGLKFVPDAGEPHQTGKLDITVLVKHQEEGASNIEVSAGSGSVEIQQSNSGYEATITAEGEEFQGKPDDELIELNITDQGLVDDNETIDSAFISGLPDGFTVWVGEPAAMASNAGDGTWAIPLDGNDLPANISIKPPKNWSGTLEGINLTVMSGHAGLTPTASDISFDLVVNPVANGLEMQPTLSFGDAGDKVELNLNASMNDPSKATGATGDQYTELTELSLAGFPDGQKVQFFIGGSTEPLDGSQATYNEGTWTINGLSQSDLQNLKFLHGEGTGNITVKGRTYEVGADGNQYKVAGEPQYSDWTDEKTAAINISPTVPTSGNDLFLWEGKGINGFDGEDTVQLRFGDNLGTTDFNNLQNIEIIDMRGEASGANSISGLTVEDVFNMTDDNNLLKILGDGGDTVTLESGWQQDGASNTYIGSFNEQEIKLEFNSSIVID